MFTFPWRFTPPSVAAPWIRCVVTLLRQWRRRRWCRVLSTTRILVHIITITSLSTLINICVNYSVPYQALLTINPSFVYICMHFSWGLSKSTCSYLLLRVMIFKRENDMFTFHIPLTRFFFMSFKDAPPPPAKTCRRGRVGIAVAYRKIIRISTSERWTLWAIGVGCVSRVKDPLGFGLSIAGSDASVSIAVQWNERQQSQQ